MNPWLSAFMLVTVFARSAEAHRPYEYSVGSTSDGSGNQYELVKYYTDGIFFTDPSSLQVRDGAGHIVAETPGSRDTLVFKLRGRYYVYAYDTPLSVLPTHGWVIRDAKLAEISREGYALGAILPLWAHLPGYLIAAICCLVPWPLFWRALNGSPRVRYWVVLVGAFAVAWSLMSLLVIAAYTELNLVLSAVFVAFLGIADRAQRRRARRAA